MPGEIADLMLEGCLCQICGEYLGEGDGFPVTCAGCGGDADLECEAVPVTVDRSRSKRFGCPDCGKRFRTEQGVRCHQRDVHGANVKKEPTA